MNKTQEIEFLLFHQRRATKNRIRRDKYQRIAYSIKRLGVAADRAITARCPKEKERALAWARAWGARGKFTPFQQITS